MTQLAMVIETKAIQGTHAGDCKGMCTPTCHVYYVMVVERCHYGWYKLQVELGGMWENGCDDDAMMGDAMVVHVVCNLEYRVSRDLHYPKLLTICAWLAMSLCCWTINIC